MAFLAPWFLAGALASALPIALHLFLRDPRVQDTLGARLLRERPWELEIAQVAFAEETLELAITLSTGDVLIYRCVAVRFHHTCHAGCADTASIVDLRTAGILPISR